MKITDITEARRNPEQNTRHPTSVMAEVDEYLGTLDDLTGYGITFSSLPKLGVNPKTPHNTIAGIYFYPATEYVDGGYLSLEYGTDMSYINVVKLSGNMFDIADMDLSTAMDIFNSLEEMLPMLAAKCNKNANELVAEYNKIKETYKEDLPGGWGVDNNTPHEYCTHRY